MNSLVLDSDVIIEVLRGNAEIAGEIVNLEHAGYVIAYTPVAKAEIYHGIRKGEEKRVEAFFAGCRCVQITGEAGEKAGHYLRKYHRSHGVETTDALVAAAAAINKSELFTLNHKHYPMKDVKLHSFAPPFWPRKRGLPPHL